MRLSDCPERVRLACKACRRIALLPIGPLIERYGPDTSLTELRARCSGCRSTEVEASPWQPYNPGQITQAHR